MAQTQTHAEGHGQKKPRAPMRRNTIDQEAQTVTIEGEGAFDVNELPVHVRSWLELVGLRDTLRISKLPRETFNDLIGGTISSRSPAAPRPVSPWRRAIAAALAEYTKKSDAPLTAEAAAEKMARLSRSELAEAKKDPLVVKHYRKIIGDYSSIMDLFKE